MLKKAAVVSPPTRRETRRSRGRATAMNGRSEKEKVKSNGKRGQLRRYDPLDFSLLTSPFSLLTFHCFGERRWRTFSASY
jgi:hypothetical protein